MGLSAWKQYRSSRWALRVNPSSGNLHPTELYIVRDGQVCHYAPREPALEERCRVDRAVWDLAIAGRRGFLVALTSILWREAWKYGERAFRYCQHDTGHAIAALRFAAALLGWRMTLLPRWPDERIASLLGLDRADDFEGAEHEEPECIAAVTDGDPDSWLDLDAVSLVDAARTGAWRGRANTLSPSRVAWPAIDEVAAATRAPGDSNIQRAAVSVDSVAREAARALRGAVRAREVIIQRRSAVAFDGRSTVARERFLSMLARTRPIAPPWDAITWPPQIHLLLFVHRVDGLTPGVYAYLRDPSVRDELPAARRT